MNQDQSSSYSSAPQGIPQAPAVKPPAFYPYVTYVLIGICVVMYLLQVGMAYFFHVDITGALDKNNSLIMQGQIWRLFTPIFLHGSILHIAFNMYALFYFGRMIERHYGRIRYVGLFILSGFAGNVISFMFSPYQSLGSSTSIFGLLGAVGVLIYQNRSIFGPIARQALSQLVIIAVINLIIGLTPSSSIDNWGHIGGLVGGTLFAWFAGPVYRRLGQTLPTPVVNTRTEREVVVAGAGVGALFIFLTLVALLMRRG